MYSLILATDNQNGIGLKTDDKFTIPWNLATDFRYFQNITTQTRQPNKKNAVIMGKNTWLSIGKPLANRLNIVITSTPLESQENFLSTSSFETALELAKDCETTFVIGGAMIYHHALKTPLQIENIYITKIHHDYKCNIKVDVDLGYFELISSKFYKLHDSQNNIKVDVDFQRWVLNDTFARLSHSKIQYRKPSVTKEQQYLDILKDLIQYGDFRKTRNACTYSSFGKQIEFDLKEGYPLLTTKRLSFKIVFEELLFFLQGKTDTKELSDKGIKIWEGNTTRKFLDSLGLSYEEYDMGPMYGWQWSHFNAEYKGAKADYTGQGKDQIKECLDLLKKDPHSRRILLTAYNPLQAHQGVLFPCHSLIIQFYVEKGHRLSVHMYQRSADVFLGLPINIASTSLLCHLFCEALNNDETYTGPRFLPGRVIISLGDVHLYENHYEQAITQILREPYPFPQLKFKRKVNKLNDFKLDDIEIENYLAHPTIKADMVA